MPSVRSENSLVHPTKNVYGGNEMNDSQAAILLFSYTEPANSATFFHTQFRNFYIINPRRICTARVTVLGLSVCQRLFWHYRLRGGQ